MASILHGETQTLIIGSCQLDLENCDFMSENGMKLGYKRSKQQETLIDTQNLPFGGTTLKGLTGGIKYKFEWNLWLNETKAIELWKIIQEHEYRVQNKIADPEVLLYDTRTAVLEKEPRIRAAKGAILTPTPAVPGFNLFFPIFKVSLQSPDLEQMIWGDISTTRYFNIPLTGIELDRVPITGDVA